MHVYVRCAMCDDCMLTESESLTCPHISVTFPGERELHSSSSSSDESCRSFRLALLVACARACTMPTLRQQRQKQKQQYHVSARVTILPLRPFLSLTHTHTRLVTYTARPSGDFQRETNRQRHRNLRGPRPSPTTLPT